MKKMLAALPLMLVMYAASTFSAETTITGKVTCAKCDLGVAPACATVVVAKEGGKDVVYYFADGTGAKFHKEVCKAGKEGTVTGETSMEGEKHMIKVTKVDYK